MFLDQSHFSKVPKSCDLEKGLEALQYGHSFLMVELDAKSPGRTVAFGYAETGLGPSEFLVGNAHWLRT